MNNQIKKLQIGVIGPAESEYPKNIILRNKIIRMAEKIGKLLAKNKAIVFTGGTDGIMEVVSLGAKKENGITVGTPGKTRKTSNKYIDVEILTPIDVGDFIFAGVLSSDAIITIPGGAGTMAELCIAYRYKKPIIIIKGLNKDYDRLINNYLDEGKSVLIYGAKGPEDAVKKALLMAKKSYEDNK